MKKEIAEASSSRIRVLHSVGHLSRGGIETWLFQMVEQLDSSRFEHHVLVWTDREEPFTAQFRAAGAKVLPCLNHSNPLKLTRNLSAIIHANGPYDILHTHGTHFQGIVMMAAGILGVRKRIAHSHNDIRPVLAVASLPYRLYAAAGRGAVRHLASAGYGVSERAAECMFGARWQRDPRWHILHCGVYFKPFFRTPDQQLRGVLGIPPLSYVVGHVGRFVPQKNHALIVQIAEELLRRHPRFHFLLIGDGPLRQSIFEQLQEKGLSERVTFVPDTTDISNYMVSAIDCFLFPSLYEGVGLAAVEAQAAGLPVVLASNIPIEVVIDASMVQRISLDSPPTAWADAIERAPTRKDTCDPSFQRSILDSRFNIDQSAAGLAAAYEQVMRT